MGHLRSLLCVPLLASALTWGCGADSSSTDGGPSRLSAACASDNMVSGARSSATYRFRYQGADAAHIVSVAITEETASHFKIDAVEDGSNVKQYLFAKVKCFDTVINGKALPEALPSRWSEPPSTMVAAIVHGGGYWDPATLFVAPVALEASAPAPVDPTLDPPNRTICTDNQIATVPAGSFVVMRCRSSATEASGAATIVSSEHDFLLTDGAARPFGGLIREEIRYADAAPSTVELVSWNGL